MKARCFIEKKLFAEMQIKLQWQDAAAIKALNAEEIARMRPEVPESAETSGVLAP